MFEEYLADTADLLARAKQASAEGDEKCAKRFYRASAMVGVAALETFVNFIASTFEEAGPDGLEVYELAFLLDRRFNQSAGEFAVRDQPQYSRLEDKLRFLIRRFAVAVDPAASADWSRFMNLKRLRDGLVHAKEDEDEHSTSEYEKTCSEGLRGCVGLMNEVSKGIFKRPLRAKLKDLTP